MTRSARGPRTTQLACERYARLVVRCCTWNRAVWTPWSRLRLSRRNEVGPSITANGPIWADAVAAAIMSECPVKGRTPRPLLESQM